MKTVFINPERCLGCRQCVIACTVEHSQSKNVYGTVTEKPLPRTRIHLAPGLYLNTSLPNKCRHCDPAPCIEACPTGALSRNELGVAVVDGYKCISCAMCAVVCPFDVLTFYPSPKLKFDKPVALKCDLCMERLKRGENPACVDACKSGTLEFGELNELVKKARTDLSKTLSIAVSQARPEHFPKPEAVKTWQQWGEAVYRINRR